MTGSGSDWGRVKAILADALERPLEEREAFLDSACRGDAALRREVDALILAEREEWSFFDAPPPGWAAPLPEPLADAREGSRVGPYEILRELGHGGMGQVYLARRADDAFQKKVAIKLIRPGMAGEETLARFRTERQISAALEHPNIARLLDGGTTETGEPYFVMEYVEGDNLLDFCAQRRLPLAERLRLFETICAAVEYAHRNLVVHRDIKPSNILVAEDGAPKLLDFGIAKLLDPEGTVGDRTATVMRVLTPDYASPEQVRGGPITTATDIYSLGIVLYQLLSGRRPYHVESGEVGELLRVVCERDPERPSTAAAAASAKASESETDADSAVLPRHLRGDLDAIVMKAIRKEPERRYGFVGELADDIRRYLDAQPVRARRGTLSYRAGKFVWRHRVGLVAAAVVAVALAGGVVATLREARRARVAEARAQRRFEDVRKLANSFLFEFHDAIRGLPGATAARALLVKRGLEYLDGLAQESAGDRELRRELSEAYQKVGDVAGNPYQENLGDLKGAIDSYVKAIALLEPIVASGKANDAERSTLANAYLISGGIRVAAGDVGGAIPSSEKGLALRRELAQSSPGDTRRMTELAQAWQFYAFNLSAAGRPAEAYDALLKQAAILKERLAAAPTDRNLRRGLGNNYYLTAAALSARGSLEEASHVYEEAAHVDEKLVDEDPTSVLFRRDLAWVLMDLGNLDVSRHAPSEAMANYRLAQEQFRWISEADPKNADGKVGLAMTHQNVGRLLLDAEGWAAAHEDLEKAGALYRPLLQADPSNAWVGGLMAELDLDLALTEDAAAKAAPPPERAARQERACGFYARSTEAFTRLSTAGRLHGIRESSFARAREGSARCGGAVPSSPGPP
jgi:non-specific serine/threonine protein kinase/serine/threonine-protein kinase